MNKKHLTKQSSIGVYHDAIVGKRENTQCKIVLDEIKRQGLCTRRMLSKALGIETSTISARVNKLIADEDVVETGIMPCAITGKRVHWLTAAPDQRDLFGTV